MGPWPAGPPGALGGGGSLRRTISRPAFDLGQGLPASNWSQLLLQDAANGREGAGGVVNSVCAGWGATLGQNQAEKSNFTEPSHKLPLMLMFPLLLASPSHLFLKLPERIIVVSYLV